MPPGLIVSPRAGISIHFSHLPPILRTRKFRGGRSHICGIPQYVGAVVPYLNTCARFNPRLRPVPVCFLLLAAPASLRSVSCRPAGPLLQTTSFDADVHGPLTTSFDQNTACSSAAVPPTSCWPSWLHGRLCLVVFVSHLPGSCGCGRLCPLTPARRLRLLLRPTTINGVPPCSLWSV